MADHLVLIEAHKQGEVIAAALNIRHDDVLYGRYGAVPRNITVCISKPATTRRLITVSAMGYQDLKAARRVNTSLVAAFCR